MRKKLETLQNLHATQNVTEKEEEKKNLLPPRDYPLHDDGYSYKIYHVGKSWDEAQAICQSEGAHLPVIRDERMRNFVHNLMPAGTWIGLTDQLKPGQWLTWDGKEAPFLYWRQGEPNEDRGREDCCLVGVDNVMNDAPCHAEAPFVCQIESD